LLHQLRWRKAPPQRGRRWLVVGIVLVLHALFIWLTWHEMRSLPEWATAEHRHRDALQVRLIPRPVSLSPAAAAPPIAPPSPTPPAPPAVKPPVVHEAPARNAMTVSLPPTPPAPATSVPPSPQLYDAAGRVVLPSSSSTAPAPEAPGYVQRGPQGDSKVMQHNSPVTYQATRFEKDWSKGGSAVDDVLQRAADKTTVKHTFHLAPGVRIHCAITFAALAGGCGGDPPPSPPSNDGDMRMNMAPASQLAPGSPEPKAPSVDECIAIYRANKPLPHGCPVDTPTRSVDAEMRERAHQSDQGGG
jgi:hypothetical protein